jgi:hypothetical protein
VATSPSHPMTTPSVPTAGANSPPQRRHPVRSSNAAQAAANIEVSGNSACRPARISLVLKAVETTVEGPIRPVRQLTTIPTPPL